MSDQRIAALSWGVKQSFRSYVEAMGGMTETRAGAAREADGAITFSAADGEGLTLDADGRPQGRGGFLGEVRFEAHGGMLRVFLADPVVEIGPAAATLSVADGPARTARVQIASLDLASMTTGDEGEIVIPTALTIEGSFLLGDHYPPRTALDPVRLKLAPR